MVVREDQEIAAVFLLQGLVLKEEPRESSDVLLQSMMVKEDQEIAAVFLLQSLMVKEEPRDNSGVFAVLYDGKERAR